MTVPPTPDPKWDQIVSALGQQGATAVRALEARWRAKFWIALALAAVLAIVGVATRGMLAGDLRAARATLKAARDSAKVAQAAAARADADRLRAAADGARWHAVAAARGDSLRASDSALAVVLARRPKVDTVSRAAPDGRSVVPIAVVTAAAYDALHRACERAQQDCRATLAAKDGELASKDRELAAGATQRAADSTRIANLELGLSALQATSPVTHPVFAVVHQVRHDTKVAVIAGGIGAALCLLFCPSR